MSAEDFAAVVAAMGGGGVSLRTMVVAAVNAGPPKSLDLKETSGGSTVLSGIRYSNSYNIAVPGVNDVVMVLVSQGGGSGRHGARVRGGNAFVIDKIAV